MAVPDWLPTAQSAAKDYARDGFLKKCTFPYEWLIVENVMKLEDLDFSDATRKKVNS